MRAGKKMAWKRLLAGVATSLLVLASSARADNGLVDPLYGNINPFYGTINPFYGVINPFYGKISPFWGDINPFWGPINPFTGNAPAFYGKFDAFWGSQSPYGSHPLWGTVMNYWKSAGSSWGNINTNWNNLQSNGATNFSTVQGPLSTFLSKAATYWNPAVQAATGQDFWTGVANPLLSKYGIDPNNAVSLAGVSAESRSRFFLDLYDNLMSTTGVDHADWWMPAVHWSPFLSQMANSGNGVIVGVLDSTVDASGADIGNVSTVGGYKYYVNDHGAAVASLIAADHDGTSIMGLAPDAKIHLYNPFDATGTASWSDVVAGLDKLSTGGIHVINASLGVPGTVFSSEWVDVLTDPKIAGVGNDLIIVKAAGNDGITQLQDVAWQGSQIQNNFVIVGALNPSGTISTFSNKPGEACLTLAGACTETNKLKYHFLVAPGELILVSDNHDGVVRMSGTSFAAPLVTGTIALMESRWPWLDNHADETLQILFQSADDLGAKGVDAVYGWGRLNVEAAMSPLKFGKLAVYQPASYDRSVSVATGYAGAAIPVGSTVLSRWANKSLKTAVMTAGQLQLWQDQKAYIVAFEPIGTTYRDFIIPLSTRLVGKSQTVNGVSSMFQAYLYQRLIDWANGTTSLGYNSRSAQFGDGAWSLGVSTTEASDAEMRAGEHPIHSEFAASNRELGVSVRLGEGAGAHALAGEGFTFRSDFDPATGGVNPVLGFASGGAYAKGSVALGPFTLSYGLSRKDDRHLYFDPTFGPELVVPLSPNRAQATLASVDYRISDRIIANVSYTKLSEADGIFGAQGAGPLDLGATRTEAMTVGFSADLGDGWRLAQSATLARTPDSSLGALRLTNGGLLATAFEVAASKTSVFGDADSIRLTIAQPLHVESGGLLYDSIEVLDRETGALGPRTQTWHIAGKRELRLEVSYATPVLDDRMSLETFSLVDVNAPVPGAQVLSLSTGARLDLRF
jgi:hypothetical protein